jgi:hypothetical protein
MNESPQKKRFKAGMTDVYLAVGFLLSLAFIFRIL